MLGRQSVKCWKWKEVKKMELPSMWYGHPGQCCAKFFVWHAIIICLYPSEAILQRLKCACICDTSHTVHVYPFDVWYIPRRSLTLHMIDIHSTVVRRSNIWLKIQPLYCCKAWQSTVLQQPSRVTHNDAAKHNSQPVFAALAAYRQKPTTES